MLSNQCETIEPSPSIQWGDFLAGTDGNDQRVCGVSSDRILYGAPQTQWLEVLAMPYERLPCYSTIRRAWVRVDFESLTQVLLVSLFIRH
jgi:hypothetical protein